jgi:hypothetical protein
MKNIKHNHVQKSERKGNAKNGKKERRKRKEMSRNKLEKKRKEKKKMEKVKEKKRKEGKENKKSRATCFMLYTKTSLFLPTLTNYLNTEITALFDKTCFILLLLRVNIIAYLIITCIFDLNAFIIKIASY